MGFHIRQHLRVNLFRSWDCRVVKGREMGGSKRFNEGYLMKENIGNLIFGQITRLESLIRSAFLFSKMCPL